MQIKLPEDYVYFLTQISNGGAGPYYGLCSLEKFWMKYLLMIDFQTE